MTTTSAEKKWGKRRASENKTKQKKKEIEKNGKWQND